MFWEEAQRVVAKQLEALERNVVEARDAFQYVNNVTSDSDSQLPKLPIRGRQYPKEMFADFV